MNQGECPKCGKRLFHVRIENVLGQNNGSNDVRCLSYSCIHCNAVVAVQWIRVRGPGASPRAPKVRPDHKPVQRSIPCRMEKSTAVGGRQCIHRALEHRTTTQVFGIGNGHCVQHWG
jgi:hypothetical protein